MSNGIMQPKTTKEYLIKIDQKLDDFLKEHREEHKIIWKLIVGIPSLLIVLFTLVKVFGG